MDAVEAAEEKMKAEASRMAGKKPNDVVPEKIKRPDWIEERGFCEVGVRVPGIEGTAMVITDPGFQHMTALDMAESASRPEAAKFLTAMARSIIDWKIKARYPNEDMGLRVGDVLPLPSKYVGEHTARWESWEKACRDAVRKVKDGDPELPDMPRTLLETLLMQECPSSVLMRALSALRWTIAADDEGLEGNS